jgi:Flp pilus assembly protein TadG
VRAGAHLVEFAIVIPIFMVFVLALVELGRGMMATSLVANAARAGCRTGVIPGKTNTDVNAAVDGLLQAEGMTGYTTTITVNGNNADVSTANSEDIVIVSIAVPVPNESWLPRLSYLSGYINGQFSLPHE